MTNNILSQNTTDYLFLNLHCPPCCKNSNGISMPELKGTFAGCRMVVCGDVPTTSRILL